MAIGPKGEKRPANPIEAGIMAARIAVATSTRNMSRSPRRLRTGAKAARRAGKPGRNR